MKKVSYQYGCKALGYTDGEIFVDEDMTRTDIEQMIADAANFSVIIFNIEDGYEPQAEIVYRKVR